MNLLDTILVGIKEIWAHKFRSMLTMLGIILGVSSLVAMSALVKGMENGMKEALVAMGGLEKVRVEAQDDLPAYQKHLTDQTPGLLMRDVYALQGGAPLWRTLRRLSNNMATDLASTSLIKTSVLGHGGFMAPGPASSIWRTIALNTDACSTKSTMRWPAASA